MATVRIDFVQPSDPDLIALRIHESSEKEGVYAEIERVTPIGTYPNYISYYTTDQATSAVGWFRIQWEDSKGALSELSAPWQGGTDSVVGAVVRRVLLRDPSIDEAIATQEAEAVICCYYGVDDPYSITEMPNPAVLHGLTLLTMASCYVTDLLVGGSSGATSVSDYTAGLVSQKSGTGTASGGTVMSLDGIQGIIDFANKCLGRQFSLVLQMAPFEDSVTYTLADARYDHTRLLLDVP